jgi:tRNA threonylcarbamoyladenosine modification (KEOPS) complex  Pcc1 subunit
MRSEVELETERPEKLKQVLEPSLVSNEDVSYEIETGKNKLMVEVETDGIGPLRGCTDTVFRLSTLAMKLY